MKSSLSPKPPTYWTNSLSAGDLVMMAAVFVWRVVPETKGKTLEEMEELLEKG